MKSISGWSKGVLSGIRMSWCQTSGAEVKSSSQEDQGNIVFVFPATTHQFIAAICFSFSRGNIAWKVLP